MTSGAVARDRRRVALLVVLVVGLAARLVLALVLAPGAGFAGDMNLFLEWGRGFTASGPAAFYSSVSSANYPPVAIWLLGGLWDVSAAFGGGSPAHLFLVLLKVPSVLADIGTAVIVAHLVARRGGPTVGVVAAAAYLLVPAVWYDSTLWGQLDSVLVFGSMAALALLISRRPLLAGGVAMLTLLFKPQGIVVAIVVYAVIVLQHLRRGADGRRHPLRLLGIAGFAAAVMLAVLVPFDYERFAPAAWSGVPLVADVAGFAVQSIGTAATYPVLTANAFNVWALIGQPPLISTIGSGTVVWLLDSMRTLGVSANLVGAALLGFTLLAVLLGLLRRRDELAVLFGYAVLTAAFFAFPTRVHERYLMPFFAVAVVLAAPSLLRLAGVLLLGFVNTVNLHAILANGPGVQVAGSGASGLGGGGGGPGQRGPGGGPGGGGSFRGAFGQAGGAGTGDRAQALSLPWGDLARTEWVSAVVSVAQTGVAAVLLVAWIVFVLRPREPAVH